MDEKNTTPSAQQAPGGPQASMFAQTFRRLLKNPGAVFGLCILVLLVVVALAAPWLSPYNPIKIDPAHAYTRPSMGHLLGTDQFGRDLLSQIIWGSRISLSVGLISVGIASTIGTLIGLIAGYYGGRVDNTIVMLVDLMMAFPGILLAMVVIAVLGPGIYNVMVAVGIAAMPSYIRVVRGSVLSVREQTYVEAGRAAGLSNRLILLRHILPNVLSPVIVLATLGLATSILSGTALSFLGLGAQPPTPEWGALLSKGRNYLQSAWWIATFPGLAIMVTTLAVNLLGDGLRDALDPRLRV